MENTKINALEALLKLLELELIVEPIEIKQIQEVEAKCNE